MDGTSPSFQHFSIDRSGLERILRTIVDGTKSLEDFNAWLTAVLVSNDVDVREEDSVIVWDLVMRLASEDDTEHQSQMIGDYLALFEAIPSNETVELLLPVVGKRHALAQFLRTHLAGTITRTGLLKHVSKHWPNKFGKRILTCSRPDLEVLLQRLSSADFRGISLVVTDA